MSRAIWARDYRARRKLNDGKPLREAVLGATERERRKHLRKHYGISPADYDELSAAQGGVCRICGEPETLSRKGITQRLSVDHDHSTGQVRGLLCHHCNVAIGWLETSADLSGLLAYLATSKVDA